jgi:hypothetical protein
MITERLTDLPKLDLAQVAGILASGKTATIQFSKPCYNPSLLTEIDSLCRQYGDRIEVRFYGHYSSVFDASNLALLPNVQWLSIDCLMRITAIEHLFALSKLRRLSLGVFELDAPDILERVQSSGIRELFLCETRKANIDLGPLVRFPNLARLHIASHCSGFAVLKDLDCLTELSLRSLSKKQSIQVLSGAPQLEKLELILGGRENIDEFSHGKLRELVIVRVLGFSQMGDLGRFPCLRQLRIEDQIKLVELDMTKAPPTLCRLALLNCKKLKQIGRLDHLINLEDLRIGRTDIDYDALLKSPLPSSLRTMALWTGSTKANAIYRARLDAMGYTEFTKK